MQFLVYIFLKQGESKKITHQLNKQKKNVKEMGINLIFNMAFQSANVQFYEK